MDQNNLLELGNSKQQAEQDGANKLLKGININ